MGKYLADYSQLEIVEPVDVTKKPYEFVLFYISPTRNKKFYWCGNNHMDDRLEKAKRYPTPEAAAKSSRHIKRNKGQWRRSGYELELMHYSQLEMVEMEVA